MAQPLRSTVASWLVAGALACAWSNPGPSPAAPAPAQPSGTAARPEAPPRDPVVNAPELPDAQNDSLKRAILADSLRADSLRADSLRADSLRKAQRRR